MGGNSIPDCPVVTDLIPGDPSVLEVLAESFALYSSSSAESAARMRPLAKVEEWGGPAAKGFVGQMEDLPKTMDKAVRHFTDAANALRGYASALRQAQADVAARVIPEANAARAWSAQWQVDRAAAANGAVGLSLPDKDLGRERLKDAEDELGRIRGRLKDAQHEFTERIDKGIQAAPSGGDPVSTALAGFGGGAKDSVLGLVQTAAMLNPGRAYAEPGAYLTDLQQIASSYGKAFTDPLDFAKGALNWDEWRKDPARALGLTAPDLLVAALTGGGSKAATIAKVAEPDAPNPIDLSKKDRPKNTREDCGDPVDPVTGEVSLPQVDLRLDGALPLVLGREHRSAYRHGRHFGVSWASFLDQHVEFDGEGVVFRSADGAILHYPMPEPDRFVLPHGGSRWPLAWDGEPEGTVVIGQPKLGVGLTFRPIERSSIFVLESMVDRNGNAIALDYDDAGTLIGIRHNGGRHIGVDTKSGRIVALRLLDTHPESHLTAAGEEVVLARFGYGNRGDLTEVFDSSGEAQRFTYDDEHRMTSWRDRNGGEYHYEYDTAGRCVRARGSDGYLNGSFAYDETRRVTSHTNSLGDVTRYTYNKWSQVERITDPLGHSVVREWDRSHQLLAVTDACGHTTRYTYDGLGNVSEVVRPDGTRVSAEYDDTLCLPVRLIGPDGSVRSRSYSARGTLLASTDAAGHTTTYDEDRHGNVAAITDELGATTTLTRDDAGMLVRVMEPSGAVTSYEHDAWGRVVAVIAPDGAVTRQGWTVEGRPAWRERPDGTRQTWTLDGEGNPVEQRDAAGGLTRFETTHFDLPTARTGPDGVRYEFAYDTELRLTEVTDPHGNTWTYEYDPVGRLIAETDFNGREVTYRHDQSGRLTLRSNGTAEPISFTHDAMGRELSRRHEATGRVTTFEYDSCGRLVRATNPDVDLVLERDVLGRVVAEHSNGRVLANTFDAGGRRTRRETPTGTLAEWHWDTGRRPTALTTAGETMVFSYDQAGREVGRDFGANLRLDTTWDINGRLSTRSLSAGESRPRMAAVLDPAGATADRLTHREYTYRADGFVTSVDDQATGLRTYDLDPVGRVTAVHGRNWSERYAYDAAGNATDAIWPGTDTDSQGERVVRGTLLHRAGRTRQIHDDQGRVVRRTRKTLSGGTKTWIFAWDADDRLTNTTTPTGEYWEYVYDALGRRTEKRRRVEAGGDVVERITFTWDGTRLAEQSTDTEIITWEHDPAGHHPLTQTNRTIRARTDPGNETQDEIDRRFHAIVTDLVGTPTELVSVDREIVWQLRSTLWGVSTATVDTVDCPFRFPGQYHDTETDSSYNLFRYYKPDSISYQSTDPLGLAVAPNHHGYVVNPLTGYDPFGLAPYELGDHSDAAEQGAAHLQDEIARGNDNHRIPGVDMANRDAVAKYLDDVQNSSPGYSVRGGQRAWYDPDSRLVIISKNSYSMTARSMTPGEWQEWLSKYKD
ncbi:DUF6531 domain-containing protein [Embleya sp. NPDC005971]|uniref:DUF6531 domain-containing protein n=1 Tax=Embleya sp. NPDC005971 TaxID=3156724 RepID=UPI0033C183C5